METQKNA